MIVQNLRYYTTIIGLHISNKYFYTEYILNGGVYMLYALDSRCQDILRYLIYAEGYVTIQELSKEQNISKRSVYYDLCKINDWLESYQVESVVIERKKGIYISKKQQIAILELLKYVSANSLYLFSPMERVKIIISNVLKRDHPIFIENFMNLCNVSRNTIISDLKVVVTKLKESNLNLVYENKEGYRIKGDVIKKRSVFFLMFTELVDLYKKDIIPLENKEKVTEIYNRLQEIERHLQADYVSGILFSIAVFFSSIASRNEELIFSIRDKMEISHTEEYKLVTTYFKDFNESEQYYLSLHLLGSRLQTVPINLMKESDQESYTLAKALVTEFSRLACVEFESVDEIEQALFAHLKTSLYRYRYGIQLGNPMLNDIKNQYPELFALTKKACEYLEQQIGVPIPDGEVAYITLHFGGCIEGGYTHKNNPDILIVCPNGISTGNMLRKEVRTLVPHAKKIKVISLTQYSSHKNYDVVISTVTIEDAKNLIIVHPILTDNDRVMILRKCMKNESRYNIDTQAILKIAEQYIPPSRLNQFKADLLQHLLPLNTNPLPQKQNYGYGIMHYIDKEHIYISDKNLSWKDSIHYVGEKLLSDGIIEKRYIDSIIQRNEELGPCMFITDNVVLAHAKVEEGAIRLGINLGIFTNPVKFAENKQAKIMIFLVAENQESHLRILNDIMTIFSDKNNINKIADCLNPDSVISCMKNILDN